MQQRTCCYCSCKKVRLKLDQIGILSSFHSLANVLMNVYVKELIESHFSHKQVKCSAKSSVTSTGLTGHTQAHITLRDNQIMLRMCSYATPTKNTVSSHLKTRHTFASYNYFPCNA